MKKYLRLVLAFIVVVTTGIILLRYIYVARERTLDLRLHGSYTIDTSGIREYVHVSENVPFTYFLQLASGSSNRNNILKDHKIELPDELLADIASSDESRYVLLSIGRDLKEVKYKFMKRYWDGITSVAMVTFCEEYQDGTVYVYFMEKNLYFFGEYYYMMNGDERVYLGNNIRLVNEIIDN